MARNRVAELDRGVSAILSVTNRRVNAEYFEFRFCIYADRSICIVQSEVP